MGQKVALAAIAAFAAALARAQSAPPDATPTPAAAPSPAAGAAPAPATGSALAPTPTPAGSSTRLPPPVPIPILRLADPPVVSVETLPTDNPFATPADAPAMAPVKPVYADLKIATSLFAAVRVDAKGKPISVRRARDPIPALAAQTQTSLLRWAFDPGKKAGQAVETWASLRLDLVAEIDAPKVETLLLTPILPSTPIPKPLDWGSDPAWLESVKPPPPTEGVLPIEQLDTPPVPRKQPWSSSSYKGPFSVKFWVRINPAGHVEKSIPIQASEPVLIAYFRKTMETWAFRPARAGNAGVATWNELVLAGTFDYSTELKMTTTLRQSL